MELHEQYLGIQSAGDPLLRIMIGAPMLSRYRKTYPSLKYDSDEPTGTIGFLDMVKRDRLNPDFPNNGLPYVVSGAVVLVMGLEPQFQKGMKGAAFTSALFRRACAIADSWNVSGLFADHIKNHRLADFLESQHFRMYNDRCDAVLWRSDPAKS